VSKSGEENTSEQAQTNGKNGALGAAAVASAVAAVTATAPKCDKGHDKNKEVEDCDSENGSTAYYDNDDDEYYVVSDRELSSVSCVKLRTTHRSFFFLVCVCVCVCVG
jgi:hypothetical protein